MPTRVRIPFPAFFVTMTGYDFMWKREYSLFYGALALKALKDVAKREIKKDVKVRCEGLNNWFSVYSEKGALASIEKSMTAILEADSKELRKEIDGLHKYGKRFVDFTKKIKKSVADKELFSLYNKYFSILTKYCEYLWT